MRLYIERQPERVGRIDAEAVVIDISRTTAASFIALGLMVDEQCAVGSPPGDDEQGG
jgi:hypothetical protein